MNYSKFTTASPTHIRDLLLKLDKAMATKNGLVGEQDDLVENQIPLGVSPLSLEHALFLFMIVPNDRGTKSSALWQRAKEAFSATPELFNPQKIVELYTNKIGHLATILANTIKPRYANNAAEAWYSNAVKLLCDYDGDPRNVFAFSPDARVTSRLIQGFKGFGPKTGGMMLRAVIGLGWASSKHIEEVELPVDVHDVRICIQTSIINPGKKKDGKPYSAKDYSTLAPEVRHLLTRTCAEFGISWMNIDRALWLIGSRGCARRRCTTCPLTSACSAAPKLLSLK